MSKRFSLFLALGLAVAVPSAFAASIPLTPGTSTPGLVPNGSTFPGILVASVSGATLVNSLNSGEGATLNERVYSTGTGLDFFYQITNTSTDGDALNTVALRNFTGFNTAVSYITDNGGTVAPSNAPGGDLSSRSGGGDTLNFFYQATAPADGQIAPGATTFYVEIDTNAPSFNTNGTAGVIDGGTAQVGGIYSPAVPEPVTMGLFGGGLALLGIARWRRASKKA